jgi:Sulfotransferase family
MNKKYRIIYVAGMTHSGSTLLDLMISANSNAFSVGEAFQLADYAHARRVKNETTKFGNECTCGAETIWHCSFWPKIDDLVREKSGLGLRDLDIQSSDPETFRKHNELFFDAVAEATGAGIIVDSSKIEKRLRGLVQSRFAPVLPIHLMRDPCGQVYSVARRRHQMMRPALRYCRETIRIVRLLNGMPHLSVRYEDLVRQPAEQLRRIMAGIGVAYEPGQLSWHDKVRHNLSGNVMRKSGDGAIRIDEAWRRNMNIGQKTLIRTLTAPAMAMAQVSMGREADLHVLDPLTPSP